MQAKQDPAYERNEIDLLSIISSARNHFVLIFTLVLGGIALAIIYLQIATYKYEVRMTVTPVEVAQSRSGGGLSAMASLAGLDLPSTSSRATFDLYLAGLTSRSTADELAANPRIMHTIFADDWSETEKKWRRPPGLISTLKNFIKVSIGGSAYGWKPPASPRLHEFLTNKIEISKDKDSPIVTISIEWADPEFAKYFLSELNDSVDSMVRQRALERSTNYVNYVTSKLATVTVSDYREALIGILATQERTKMMASANVPFAAESFGTPASSREPVSPRPILIIIFSVIFGLLIGLGISFFLQKRKKSI